MQKSQKNPADHGKRELFLTALKEKWLSAAKFLLENPVPSFQRDQQIETTNVLRTETSITKNDANDFSNWNKLMRLTETVMKAVNIFRKRPVTNSYEDAKRYLLRQLQHKTFSDSIRYIERGREIDKRGKLLQFNPLLDKDVLIRARGRLKHAKIPYNQRHPISLDSKNNSTKLLIERAHKDCRHLGAEFVRAHLQQDFVIIGLRRFLKQLSKNASFADDREHKTYPLNGRPHQFQIRKSRKTVSFSNLAYIFSDPFT